MKIGLILTENRLVMLEDLIETKGNLVDNLEVDKDIVLKKRPSHCPSCCSDKICGIEVMGGYDGILLWECDICEKIFLRFKEDRTEEFLQSAKGVWTNPQDWGYVPRSEFN
jgi:hypothetical protein